MIEAIFINTAPGHPGAFSPLAEVEDYTAWLSDRVNDAQWKDGKKTLCYGVAQKVNQVIHAGQAGTHLYAVGQYAGAAATVIEKLSGNSVEIHVIG